MARAPKPIVIVGAGGYAQEVAWLIDDINAKHHEWQFLGFVDPVNSGRKEHYGYPILGGYAEVSTRFGQPYFTCGIGTPEIRLKESTCAESHGWQPAALIHPSVFRAKFVSVGEGTTIGPACVLGPYVTIGRHALLNVHATIGHNTAIGDFTVISPGARILGNVTLSDLVCVGANATVYPGRKISSCGRLGANSFLHIDLDAGQSVIGVPARPFLPPTPSSKRQS